MSEIEITHQIKSWPFEEAKAIADRLKKLNRGKIKASQKIDGQSYVLFETGYGPSGLPHIGTFGEVCRTNMVLHAFKTLYPDMPVKMICFSDDMDGLRKVPENVPNKDLLAKYIGHPLTKIPNPFPETQDIYKSYAEHNNAQLCAFLDKFGFEYNFYSSTEFYGTGKFDEGLKIMLEKHDEIREAVIPILGDERTETYSPFLPISPKTGKVLQVPILETHPDRGTIVFKDEDGTLTELPVTGSNVKAQWRADWALRWYCLDVDYEMSGVDLTSSAEIAGEIVKIMGKRKPAGFHYQLFLDQEGKKISKSKGNGLNIQDWLTYAPHETLAYYMYLRPTSGKKLYFDIIPKAVDEYIALLQKYETQDYKERLDNPVWYIHNGDVPMGQKCPVSYTLLLNLISVTNIDKKEDVWKYIQKFNSSADPSNAHFLDRLIDFAIKYCQDFIFPNKKYRLADAREKQALGALASVLETMQDGLDPEGYMTAVFTVGKENGYDKTELKTWFEAIYQVLLGQDQGPRFGSFIAIFGRANTVKLIRDILSD